MVRLVLLSLLTAALGCAFSQPTQRWEQAGATQEDYKSDQGHCLSTAVQTYDRVRPGYGGSRAVGGFRSCMEQRGWRLVDVEDEAAGGARSE